MNACLKIQEQIKNNSLPNIVALLGQDKYWPFYARDVIYEAVIGKSNDTLNQEMFFLDEKSIDEPLIALNTLPFLAKKRLIEIRKIEKLSSNDQDKLINYIENPADFSFLLIVLENIDKRNKLYHLLNSKGFLYDFDEDKDLKSIFVNYNKKYNMAMNDEVKNLLISISNQDSGLLSNYLDKLSLVAENRAIIFDDINNMLKDMGEPDAFELVRYIAEGNLEKSLFFLGHLRNSGENALKFLGLMAWQFRVILNICHYMEQGMLEYDIRKKVNVYGARFSWMAKIAKSNNINFHIQRLTRLIKADLLLKSVNLDDSFCVIENMIYQSVQGLKRI